MPKNTFHLLGSGREGIVNFASDLSYMYSASKADNKNRGYLTNKERNPKPQTLKPETLNPQTLHKP